MAEDAPMEGTEETSTIGILVVDDAPDIRFMLSLVIGHDDRFHIIGEAENGAHAVERARDTQPDLIVLDLTMPVMDGLEAIPRIREQAPRTKILAFSGQPPEVGEDAIASCADAYVEKGASAQALTNLLAEIHSEPHKSIGVRILRS